MKRIAFAIAALALLALGGSETASANNTAGYPFFPFGFYQPYGAQYGNSISTPPYFATNPPVYYGARHARPYGMSPFASPPLVGASQGYRGRLRTNFTPPPVKPITRASATCNPCVSHNGAVKPVVTGLVRTNPFVAESQLANN